MPVFDAGEGSSINQSGLLQFLQGVVSGVPAGMEAFDRARALKLEQEKLKLARTQGEASLALERDKLVQQEQLARAAADLDRQRIELERSRGELERRRHATETYGAALELSKQFGVPPGEVVSVVDGLPVLSLDNVKDKTIKGEVERKMEELKKLGLSDEDALRQIGGGLTADAVSDRAYKDALAENNRADAALKRQQQELIEKAAKEAEAAGRPISDLIKGAGKKDPPSFAAALSTAFKAATIARSQPYTKVGNVRMPNDFAARAIAEVGDLTDRNAMGNFVRRGIVAAAVDQLGEVQTRKLLGLPAAEGDAAPLLDTITAQLESETESKAMIERVNRLFTSLVPTPGNDAAKETSKFATTPEERVNVLIDSIRQRAQALRFAQSQAGGAMSRNPAAAQHFMLAIPELFKGMPNMPGAGAAEIPAGIDEQSAFGLDGLQQAIDDDANYLEGLEDTDEPGVPEDF